MEGGSDVTDMTQHQTTVFLAGDEVFCIYIHDLKRILTEARAVEMVTEARKTMGSLSTQMAGFIIIVI
jgi:hypothetical protein